ncbi:hypothetical protein AWB83_06778 [Caballeronia ptereochthonis]|uniref:Tash protein PEST motif family protein n=1 Tax=Caballeronia ptereochthonis TaxID=1777144 RepID=A0A158E9A8_9BURK|nr:hypothetical protein AWB83_06778 [Caballeronia ptereochthonis]
MIVRSLPAEPTDTVLVALLPANVYVLPPIVALVVFTTPAVIEPAPSATSFALIAVAPGPTATEFWAAAVVFAPIAVVLLPLAVAFSPNAVVFVPFEREPPPIAMEPDVPLAVALLPSAIASVPLENTL